MTMGQFSQDSLDKARLGGGDRVDGSRGWRLRRAVETEVEPQADFDAVIVHEKAISPALDGRSVFDAKRKPRQLSLFSFIANQPWSGPIFDVSLSRRIGTDSPSHPLQISLIST